MEKNRIITVQNVSIAISAEKLDDYICITDIADAKSVIQILSEIG